MRILVTGAEGQIGWELCRILAGSHEVLGTDRAALDLADQPAIRAMVAGWRPDLVINAAGYTAVDRAEAEPDLAFAINGTAVGVLAEACGRVGAAFIHYSTDYVFDGSARMPYRPDAKPGPLSVYGESKLLGEELIRAAGVPHLIIRTCWVYGVRGNNFLLTILRLANERDVLRVVNDQLGSPTWSRDVASATADIIGRLVAGSPGQRKFSCGSGTHHLSGAGVTSWHGFAAEILAVRLPERSPRLEAITSAEFGAAARRPAYSALDCTSSAITLSITLPPWQHSLRSALQALAAQEPASPR